MDKNLYFCEYWPKKKKLDYSYCLSDLIFQNERNNSLFQIHGIILKNNAIITFKKEIVFEFENFIKIVIRKFYENSEIKIWYYRQDEKKFDSEHIPSRFAITVQLSEPMKYIDKSFLFEIEKCLLDFIEKIA